MMKYLLAATAAVAMVASAAAQTMDDTGNNNKDNQEYWYECSVTKVTPSDKDKDPGYKINLYFFANGEKLFKRVVHTTRSGAQYNRVAQYTVADKDNYINEKGANVWFGTSIKNPSLTMGGIFGWVKGNPNPIYTEYLMRGREKKPFMVIESACHQI